MSREKYLILACGLIVAGLPTAIYAQQDLSEVELRRHLSRQWNVLTTQIATAEIEFTKGAIVVSPPTISLAELNALIARIDLASQPERRDEFTKAVLQGAPPLGNPWMDRKLYVKGRKIRDEGMFSIVSTPDYLVYHDSRNRHATVFAAGRSHLSFHTLNDFFRLPNDAETVVRTWPISLDSETGGILLHPPASDLGDLSECHDLLDYSTGIPIHWTTVVDGRVTSDSQCHSILQLPGGIPFPMLSFHALFQGEKLSRLDVYHAKSIRINEDLSDSLFQVSAESGSVIFDERFEEQRAVTLRADVADVVSYLDSGGAGPPVPMRPVRAPGLSLEKILLFVNGLLLVFGGIVLWKRSQS